MIDYIDSRLQDLEQEKEELRNYQTLDRQRRALAYNLYNKQLTECREKVRF